MAAHGVASMTNGAEGPRLGGDMVGYGLRLTGPEVGAGAVRPWLETARFRRPDLECLADLPCTAHGWLLRGGVALSMSRDRDAPGLHVAVLAGTGAAFAQDTALTYFLGLGLHWRQLPRVSPTAEIRWEKIGGITLGMLALGVRVDL